MAKEIDLAKKTVWVLDDGKAGHTNQSLGLALALGAEPIFKKCDFRKTSSLFEMFSPAIAVANMPKPPWPDVCIATGWHLAAVNLYIKKQSPRTFTTQILPRGSSKNYDATIAMYHDKPKKADNQITLLTAPNRITQDVLDAEAEKWQAKFGQYPKPWAAVLIGGSNKKIEFDEELANDLAEDLIHFAKTHGYSLLVTASRRTGLHERLILQDRLNRSGVPTFFWDGEGENPFMAMLGLAEAVVVTADSFSMVSEAVTTGKPVYVYGMDKWNIGKFKRTYDEMVAQNRMAPMGEMLLPRISGVLQDTQKAADFVKSLMRLR